MTDKVWISSMKSNYLLGSKLGVRVKYFDEEWHPAQHEIPVVSEKTLATINRSIWGHALARSDFPESAAVWDEKRFKRVRDLFAIGGFYVVKNKLAEILSRFDLGEGGLIPFTIYQADLKTPFPGEYFLLNFGCIKNTILPEQSENVVKFAVDHKTGQQIWKVNGWHEDGDVALSPAALSGPAIWFEDVVYNKIFMHGSLANALQEAGLADDWQLKECQIMGGAA